ncbi:ATP-binding protein [Mesorhizobium sp. A556]
MTPLRINSISIQGFRSFGKSKQSVALSPTISVFWGGNSQGKTSLTEAVEFLFTGQIARREMLASAKDEFSEALRNAHVENALPTVVEAEIICHDGQVRRVSRTLIEDYHRGSAVGCNTRLEIDGVVAKESDIELVLGLRLSHEPLRAPVLAQHTLGYLFSASPTDRATYFRAVLDTQELEDFRTAVAGLAGQVKAPTSQELTDLGTIEAMKSIALETIFLRTANDIDGLKSRLSSCCNTLLERDASTSSADLSDLCQDLDAELTRRRSLAFPITLFSYEAFARWNGDIATVTDASSNFLKERSKVAEETQRLVGLFQAALQIPDHDHNSDQDCPLCGATNSLTAARIAYIKTQTEAAKSYTDSEIAFSSAVKAVDALLAALETSATRGLPAFANTLAYARKKKGFTIAAISTLADDDALVASWLTETRTVWRRSRTLSRCIKVARQCIEEALADTATWNAADDLHSRLSQVVVAQDALEEATLAYSAAAQALTAVLKLSVDQSANITGWDALVRLSGHPESLWTAIRNASLHAKKLKDLEKAVTEIDVANSKVVDQKFLDLSDGVRHWWELLRPDEATFFDGVQRRSSKSRRIIDLKVGLAVADDRSNPKVRDAVAVLSQSQLHCLGLSIFLARAIKEQAGFIILDDPVLSSDDDYRPNFTSSVLEALTKAGVQVIIGTQDHASWKDIGHRWDHNGAIQLQLIRAAPLLGTEIRSQGDALATMMAKAAPMVKSTDPLVRKEGAQRVREAIERFAKMIVVQQIVAMLRAVDDGCLPGNIKHGMGAAPHAWGWLTRCSNREGPILITRAKLSGHPARCAEGASRTGSSRAEQAVERDRMGTVLVERLVGKRAQHFFRIRNGNAP